MVEGKFFQKKFHFDPELKKKKKLQLNFLTAKTISYCV